MSIIQQGPVWYTETLAPNQRLVALALADWADDLGRCWPSMQRIADKCGYSRRQTTRIIRELRELGYVSTLKEATPRKSPVYQLHPAVLKDDDPREGRQYDTPPDEDVMRDEGRQFDTPGMTDHHVRDDTGDTSEVTPMSPKPSENRQGTITDPPLVKDGETVEISSEVEMDDDGARVVSAEVVRFTDEVTDVIQRPRNAAFDALVELFGYTPEGNEASLFGKIAAKANLEDDPRAAVLTRASRLIAQWEPKALTPPSLLKWWNRFGSRLGAATEEEARKFADQLEAQMRRARAAELDSLENPDADVIDIDPTGAMTREERNTLILETDEELRDESEGT